MVNEDNVREITEDILSLRKEMKEYLEHYLAESVVTIPEVHRIAKFYYDIYLLRWEKHQKEYPKEDVSEAYARRVFD